MKGLSQKNVRLAQLDPLIRQLLEAGQQVKFSPHGSSMLPMLRDGKDSVTLIKPQGKLKKYDIPLYLRPQGGYVLHRVVGEDPEGYILCGDHQTALEHGVTDGQVLGVVCAFTRKGKEYTVTQKSYRLYARIWVAIRPLRRIVLAGLRRLARLYAGREQQHQEKEEGWK